MYSQPTGPRSIGGVLDDAVRLYRDSFRFIWPLLVVNALVYLIPSLFIAANSTYGANQAAQLNALLQLMASPTYWLALLVLWLLSLVLYAALIGAIDRVASGKRMGLGEALKLGVARLPRIVVIGLLLGLALVVGLMLLVIPGIYLMGIWQLVLVAAVLENTGIFASFGRSFGLIKGYWWRSAAIVTVAIIILLVLRFLVSLIAGFLAAIKVGFGSIMVVSEAVSAALNVILIGWMPCVLLAMYYDLKLRHEGQDLATRVDALAAR